MNIKWIAISGAGGLIVLAVVVLCARMLQAPAKGFGRLDLVGDAALARTLEDYYSHESAHDWRNTYSYRSDRFRKVVPYQTYASAMTQDFADWKFQGLSVESAQCVEQACVVKIAFRERANGDAARIRGIEAGSVISQASDTTWRKHLGRWIALDAGTRNHASLNANVSNDR